MTHPIRTDMPDTYDDGLEHHHHWARDQRPTDSRTTERRFLIVANAGSIRTPSTAVYDDLHHA